MGSLPSAMAAIAGRRCRSTPALDACLCVDKWRVGVGVGTDIGCGDGYGTMRWGAWLWESFEWRWEWLCIAVL